MIPGDAPHRATMAGVVATRTRQGIPSAGDLVLALAMAVLGAAGVFSESHDSARSLPPIFGGYLIAAAAAGLLAWRRRAPVTVAFGTVAICLPYHLLGYPGFAPAAAMFVAVHAVTAYSTSQRLLLAGGLIVVASVIPVLPPHPAGFNVGALLGPPIGMIATAAVGEAARARQVVANEQLRAARQTAAEEARRRLVEERLNIARELHDVLAHTITVISVQAAVGADALDERPDDTRAALAAVRSAARDAMAELRSTLVVLRAGVEAGAVEAGAVEAGAVEAGAIAAPQPGLQHLPRLVDQATAAGVTVQMTTTGEANGLPASVELAVYRIAQEALTNTIRHSAASSVAVAITFGADEVAVEVTDDGPLVAASVSPDGHEPADRAQCGAAQCGAHGLIGMRERARALGGTLDAGPMPDTGFRVAARLPVRGPG
jgi:signal transduction histidine kinase